MNLEKYRKIIKRRMSFIGLYFILIGIVSICLNQACKDNAFNGFVAGLLIVIEIIVLLSLIKNIRLLKDDKKLRKAFAKEHDERQTIIRYQTASATLLIVVLVLAVATIIAGYLNQIVFITLGLVLVAICLIAVIMKIYFNHKI